MHADTLLVHLAETHGGSSGSPVLGIDKHEYLVVGLHCSEITNTKNGNKANKAILIKSIQDAINYPDKDDSASETVAQYSVDRMHITSTVHIMSCSTVQV